MRLISRFAVTIALACTAAFAAERPPNIIFILADDLGYGELGSYGQMHIKTPNLDRLAAEGMRFTQHYAGQAVCAPSRCALLTGMHMGHAYIRDNGNPKGRESDAARGLFPGQHPIPDEAVTIAELLKSRGYATAAYGKWGLGYEGSSGDPLNQGFDDFGGFLCQAHAHNHYPRFLWKGGDKLPLPGNDRTLSGAQYSQDLFVQWGKEFIAANRDRPFFLYLPFAVPHLSIQAPDDSVAEYTGVIAEAPYDHRDGYLQHPTPRAAYAAMITHMDRGIGEIMALLGELALDNDTIVFFSSDNGPTFDRLGGSDSEYFESAAGFKGLKGSLYEGGIRVPLIARWPGRIARGAVSDHISAFWDFFPTLAGIAGGDVPPGPDGISLVPTLLGEGAQAKHEYLYWEFISYGGQQALRLGDWKGIRQNMRKSGKPVTALYNLAADRAETTDVAAEHPEIVTQIEALMVEARTPSALFPFPEIDGVN